MKGFKCENTIYNEDICKGLQISSITHNTDRCQKGMVASCGKNDGWLTAQAGTHLWGEKGMPSDLAGKKQVIYINIEGRRQRRTQSN